MKVTAIVPAYNEEKTVGSVLETLLASEKINYIIALNAGSTDNTPKILNHFKKIKPSKVKVMHLKSPIGKGGTVKETVKYIKSDIVFMCDADLYGFREEHINQILGPIEKGEAGMCIGIRKNPIIGGYFIDRMILTGGERAVLTEIFKKSMEHPLVEGWGIESVLNYYCRKSRQKIVTLNMEGVTHTLRSKKKSWWSFLAETMDVIKVRFLLYLGKS